jgi:hypothetical protein
MPHTLHVSYNNRVSYRNGQQRAKSENWKKKAFSKLSVSDFKEANKKFIIV